MLVFALLPRLVRCPEPVLIGPAFVSTGRNGSDRDFVAKKYVQTFHEVLENAEELWFAELGWGDKDAEELADVIAFMNILCLIV